MLKQGQYVPLPVEKQVAIIYAATNGFLDQLAGRAQLQRYEKELFAFIDAQAPEAADADSREEELDDDVKAKLDAALDSSSEFARRSSRPSAGAA